MQVFIRSFQKRPQNILFNIKKGKWQPCFICFVPALCHQFHQHYTRAFFVRIFRQSQNVTRKSCRNNVRTNFSYVKTLMKLTPTCMSKSRHIVHSLLILVRGRPLCSKPTSNQFHQHLVSKSSFWQFQNKANKVSNSESQS